MPDGNERARLAVLFAGVLIGALDIAIVGPALPAVRSAFDVGARWLPSVFSVYVLFYLVGTPLLAQRSDRVGRRRVFIESLMVFALGSMVVAAAWSFPALLAGRAIQALGAGGLLPVAAAVIGETVPLERRGRTLGLVGAVFGIAFLLGPVLGGLLLPLSWRALFIVNVPVALLLAVAGARLLPATARAEPQQFDTAGAVLLGVVLAGLVVGLGMMDTADVAASLATPRVWPWLLVMSIGLVALRSVERRARDPVVPPVLWREPQLRLVAGIAFAAGSVEAGMVFLPEMVVLRFRVDAATASFAMLPLVAMLAVGAPLAGWALDRHGPRIVVQAGLSMTLAGLLILALAPLDWRTFYGAGALLGFGMAALLGAPLRYIVLQEAGAERRGVGQGLLSLAIGVGQLVAAATIASVVGSSVESLAGYRQALLVIAGACTVALLLSGALRGRVATSNVRVRSNE